MGFLFDVTIGDGGREGKEGRERGKKGRDGMAWEEKRREGKGKMYLI